MWFPSRNILVELEILYKDIQVNKFPKVFCKSGATPIVNNFIDKNKQCISISIQAPEFFYLDLHNSNNKITVSSLKLDGIKINNDKLSEVFKFVENLENIPFDWKKIDKLPKTTLTEITKNGYLVFNIYEADTISYLLSIQNKMDNLEKPEFLT